MKMKKVVTMNYKRAFCSYNGVEMTDAKGNEINIIMSEDHYIELSDLLEDKKRRIEKSRLEELEEKRKAEEVD